MPYRNIYIPNNNIKQQLQTTGKVRYIGLPPIVGRNNFLDKPAVQTIIRPAQYATFGIDKGVQVLKRLTNRYLPAPIARGAKTILNYTLGENVDRGTVQVYELLNENNKKAYGGISTLTPNIVAGGKAIDLGNNFYYMQGRKHSQGGIDIGPNNKNGLEVEGGEVVQVKPNEIKVFSSVPFLRGNSPAQLVMSGANPNKVFDAQERYKDRNKLRDDGSKYQIGGEKRDATYVSKPLEQIFIPAKGATKMLQDYKKRNPQAKGNLEIVSPEFDILSVGPKTITSAINIGNKLGRKAASKLVKEVATSIISEANPAAGLILGTTDNLPNIIKKEKTDIIYKPRFKNNNNNQLKLEGKNTVQLSLPRKVSNINEIQSKGEPIIIPEFLQSNIDETRNWLKKFNKWNAYYGYEPIPLSVSKNPKEADKLIKKRLLEHNTFVRGVRDVHGDAKKGMNAMLQSKGIEPTKENRLKYMATTYAPETGAGRVGFYPKYATEGTLYTSNSYQTAAGYSKGNYLGFNAGEVAKVRRPIKFEGSRDNWIRNAEFSFDNRNANLYRDFELPYLLKEGRSIRSDILKNKNTNLTPEEYDEIVKNIYKSYIQDNISYGFNIINRDDALKKYKEYIDKYNPKYKLDLAFTKDPILTKTNDIRLRKILNDIDEAIHDAPFGGKKGREKYNIALNDYLDEKNLNIIDPFDFDNDKYFTAKNNFTRQYIKDLNINQDEYIKKSIDNIFGKYANKNYVNSLTKYVTENYKRDINKSIANTIKRKSKISNKELIDYAYEHGILPNRGTDNVFTTEKLFKTSRNKGNPYQHFVFRGEVGQPALDFIEFVPKEDYTNLNNITRMHEGQATKGLSRKSRKMGGNMIASINGNVKNGLIHTEMKYGGRKKAKLGDGFRINDTKYKVGDTFDYNGQKYYVNARNEAIPISGDISKANPDAITSASTAVDWLSNVEKFTPNVTTYKTTTKNTNKSKNNKQTFTSRKYTYNPNLVDIPETNIGNIGAYFYTNKPKSNKSKSSTFKATNQKSYSTAPVNYDNKIAEEMNDLATNIIYNLPIQPTKSTVSDLARVPSQLTRIDRPIGIAAPEYYSTNSKNKLLDGITKNDYISLGSNIAGNLISALIGSTTSRKLPYVDLPKVSAPLFLSAPKLKTTYNINPQLSEIDEQTQRAIGDINRNTGSSQVALARKQRVRNAAQTEKNKLYGKKENIETELINKDILNRQQINARNASIYNDYLDKQYQNAIRQVQLNRETDLYNQKISGNRNAGWINALSGINSGVQDLLSRLEERRSLNETLKAISARTPDASKIMNLLFGQYLK